MNTCKHILVVTPEIPFPIFKGNQNRIDQTIRLLSSLGHKISIAVLNSNQRERQSKDVEADLKKNYDNIMDVIVRRHPKFSNKTPYKVIEFIDKKLLGPDRICTQMTCPSNFRNSIKKYIKKNAPDVVLVNYLKIADVIPSQYKGMTILDSHDFATNIVKQGLLIKPINNFNINKFEMTEMTWMQKFDVTIAINPREQDEFKKRFNLNKCYTIPSFHKIEELCNKTENYLYDILFIGSSSPFNIEGFLKFNAKAIPILRRILGREPQVAVVGDVCNASSIKKLTGSYLHKLGRVDNLSDVYSKSKIVICPLLSGAGMKIKVVEALAYGKAIVTTSVGADGINITNKYNAYINDEWSDFSQSIKYILTNEDVRKKLELNAKKLALSEYSYDAVSEKWKQLISRGNIIKENVVNKNNITNGTIGNHQVNPHITSKRKKCLIFGMDARTLMGFNLDIAIQMKHLGVYSEFLKMEPEHKNYFMQHGFITHSVRQLITKQHQEVAKKWFKLNKSKPLHDLYYRNVNIGTEIETHKAMFPQHFYGERESQSIIHTVVLIEVLLDLSNKINPDFFVGWNGDGPHMIYVPKIVAAILKKPILFVERGLLPDSYVIDPQGVNFKSYSAGSFTPLLTRDRLNTANKYISEFSKANNSIVNNDHKIFNNKEDIVKHLKLNCSGYIFFPEQIEGDSNIILNSPTYKKMTAVADLLLITAKKLGLSLVVRQHPENKNNNIIYPKDVIVCNDVHIHSLLRNSEFNVTINSTTGLESLLLNKPTFVLGNSIYSGKGFTFDVRSSEEIIEHYRLYCESKDLQSRHANLFAAFLSYLISDYLIFNHETKINNASSIFSSLLERIGVGERLRSIPAATKACAYLVSKLNLLDTVANSDQKVTIINAVSLETKLYMTGPNRPSFNIEYIKKVIHEINILKIIDTDEKNIISNIENQINENAKIIILVINNCHDKLESIRNKYDSNNFIIIDEYFIPQ